MSLFLEFLYDVPEQVCDRMCLDREGCGWKAIFAGGIGEAEEMVWGRGGWR